MTATSTDASFVEALNADIYEAETTIGSTIGQDLTGKGAAHSARLAARRIAALEAEVRRLNIALTFAEDQNASAVPPKFRSVGITHALKVYPMDATRWMVELRHFTHTGTATLSENEAKQLALTLAAGPRPDADRDVKWES